MFNNQIKEALEKLKREKKEEPFTTSIIVEKSRYLKINNFLVIF